MLDEHVASQSSAYPEENSYDGRVVVAVPAYNEEVAIGSIVLRAMKYADTVVVVDDGSKDGTAEVAELAGAYVIRHSRNLGKGMAIRSAWLYARERSPDALVLMDGDHQHQPRDIPSMVSPVLEGEADVVLGVRSVKTSQMPLHRRVGKRVLDFATAAATESGRLTDSQCGFRVFSREALTQLEPEESKMSIESQMLVEAQERGLRITEVGIDTRYDVDGSTYPPVQHGFGVLGRVISLISEKRPLLFFGLFGLGLLAVAVLMAFLVIQGFISTRELAVGYSFVLVLSGTMGALSVLIGIVLNVLKGGTRRFA